MTQEEYFKFYAEHPTVEHSRPEWKNDEYWKQVWKEKSVTVIICQRQTKTAIQMTLESLFRFYPDIEVVVSDDDSRDDSSQYLAYKELVTPNLTVYWRSEGFHGHGMQLDEMLRQFVKTKYCLMLDSDVVIERGGFIEDMLQQFETYVEEFDSLYAIGTMHYGSYKGNGGEPESEDDAVPYPHPQCSMIRADLYLEMQHPFITDGAPLILNMKEAKDKNMRVAYYPTDKYVSHRGGSSYVEPRPIWESDHDVFLRPFITFIIHPSQMFLIGEGDSDFDVVIASERPTIESVIIHGREPQVTESYVYKLRFQVTGEYVCDARRSFKKLPADFITRFKDTVIKEKAPDVLYFEKMDFIKRKIWQKHNSLR